MSVSIKQLDYELEISTDTSFENIKKRPPAHAATLLTIYHRLERE